MASSSVPKAANYARLTQSELEHVAHNLYNSLKFMWDLYTQLNHSLLQLVRHFNLPKQSYHANKPQGTDNQTESAEYISKQVQRNRLRPEIRALRRDLLAMKHERLKKIESGEWIEEGQDAD